MKLFQSNKYLKVFIVFLLFFITISLLLKFILSNKFVNKSINLVKTDFVDNDNGNRETLTLGEIGNFQEIGATNGENTNIKIVDPTGYFKEFDIQLIEQIKQALNTSNTESNGNIALYTVDSTINNNDDWQLVSLGTAETEDMYYKEGITSPLSMIIKQNSSDNWEIGVEGTDKYINLLQRIPEKYIASDAKSYFDESFVYTTDYNIHVNETVEYKFPWPNATSRQWWTRGSSPIWHGAHTYSGVNMIALDFGGSGDAARKSVAAADGTIIAQCEGAYTINLTMKDSNGRIVRYFHFDKSSISSKFRDTEGKLVATGKTVHRGQFLGNLKQGDFYLLNSQKEKVTDGCGIAFQQATNSHLHFVFPKNSQTMDGWTFTYSNSEAVYLDGTKRAAGNSFSSTNIEESSESCQPPSSGDWNISQNCTITSSVSAPGNVKILNGGQLTIENNASLNINFISYALKIEPTGKVIIKPLGKLI